MAGELDTVWRETVRKRAEETALVDAATDSHWSFSELETEIEGVVEELLQQGIVSGQVLVLAEVNGLRWLSLFLAAQRLGVVVLPLELQLGLERIRASAENVGARLLWLAGWESMHGSRSEPVGSCLIKATSGTTGNPRLYVFSYAEMLADGRQVIAGMGLRKDDRNYAVIPFGHSYGLGNLVMPLVLEGTCIVCGSGYFPQLMLADLRRHKASVFPAVPPLIRALGGVEEPGQLSLRLVISAGGRLDPEVRDSFIARFGVPVRNFYGSSESGGIAFQRRDPQPGDSITVGEPLPGVCVELDPTGGVSVSSAAVYKRNNRMRGSSGFARVELADLARWTACGELELTGRRRAEVKIAGRRVSLDGLEQDIRQIGGVDDCFVHAYQHRAGEQAIACLVAGKIDVSELKASMREALPVWTRPKKCVVVEALPINVRGKPCREQMLRLLNLPGESG